MQIRGLLLFFLALILGVQIIDASRYRLKELILEENYMDIYEVGVFSRNDAPFKRIDPFIYFDLTFSQPDRPLKDLSLQVVLYQADVNDYVGKTIGNTNYACCYQDLYDDNECDNVGELIVQPEARDYKFFYQWNVRWIDNPITNTTQGLNTKIAKTIPVTKSGVWIFAAVHCGRNLTGSGHKIQLDGVVQFTNSYGELPGDILGMLPIYLFLFITYIGSAIWWGWLCWKHRDGLLLLQKFIGLVIIAGIIESFLYFLDYIIYNKTGEVSLGFNVVCVFALTFKRATCFLCLLLICHGYSLIHATLSKKLKIAIASIIAAFAVACWLYEFVNMLTVTPATQYIKVPDSAVNFLLSILSIVDFVILLWVFVALYQSVSFLSKNKQTEKLKRFIRLIIILGVAYGVSLIFFIIEAAAVFSGAYTKWWKGWWVWSGYWAMMYYFLMMFIAFLWRPDENTKRFAYSSQLETDDINAGVNSTDLTELPKHDEDLGKGPAAKYEIGDE